MASYIYGPKQAPLLPNGVPKPPESVLFGRSAVPEVHEGSTKTPTPESSPGHYLPCLNPSCKSHGRPHPNCRCYSGGESYERFASGGEVGFCSSARAHEAGCEYYSDGGEVPDWNSLSTDAPTATPDWNSLSTTAPAGAAPDWDSLSSEKPPSDGGGWLEQGKAALEGASQGLLGPLAPALETGLGISTKEAINKRAQDFPLTHGASEAGTLVGSMLLGTGEAGLIAKGAEAAAEAAHAGAIGSALIKTAVEGASFAGADEMTKSFLGQPGSDPEHPVSSALLHVGAAGLLGAATGGVFSLGEGLIGKGIAAAGTKGGAESIEKFVDRIGSSANPMKELGLPDALVSAASHIPAIAATIKNVGEGKYLTAAFEYPAIQQAVQKQLANAIGTANKYAVDAATRAIITNEFSGVPNAVHYAIQSGKGFKKALAGVSALMTSGSSQIAPPTSDIAKQKVREFIENGGVEKQMQNTMGDQAQQQGFAKGGEVKSEPNNSFSKVFPEQNTILSTAKGRISTYLNGLRPQHNQMKMPFDDAPASGEQKRQYEKALDFAVNPISILDHVNQGDLTPEHLQHFTSLYPEVHRFLSKEMTKQITQAQLSGEKPPYGKRQAMGLFLGADLDSSFSPQAIQTIQGLYASKQQAQQQQAPTKPKKGTSTLSKVSNSYLTGTQAREQRIQNQKA